MTVCSVLIFCCVVSVSDFFLWVVSVNEVFSPRLQLSPVFHKLFALVNEGFSYRGPPSGALDIVNWGPTVCKFVKIMRNVL
jgi:hypothetical protein